MAIEDIVCGMELTSARITSSYRGHTYHFCSTGCKESFEIAPWKMVRPLDRINAVVRRRVDVSPRLFILWISPSTPLTFEPGQYVVAVHPELPRTHPYTIVSAPHEPDFELYVELVPRGSYTPFLHSLNVGDIMHVRHTNGRFVLQPKISDHVMVAERHTIAPYISILRHHLRNAGSHAGRFHIIYGDDFEDELAYHQELMSMAARNPRKVRYQPVIRMPQHRRNRSWSGDIGDVHGVASEYLRSSGLAADSTRVYVCGSDKRVADLRAHVVPLGYSLVTEPWFRAS